MLPDDMMINFFPCSTIPLKLHRRSPKTIRSIFASFLFINDFETDWCLKRRDINWEDISYFHFLPDCFWQKARWASFLFIWFFCWQFYERSPWKDISSIEVTDFRQFFLYFFARLLLAGDGEEVKSRLGRWANDQFGWK